MLDNRKRTPLITYNTYRKEKKKRFKQDEFQPAKEDDSFTCPNGKKLAFLTSRGAQIAMVLHEHPMYMNVKIV
nr:hypothetical protein [Halalkalibacterium ligniniphilum]